MAETNQLADITHTIQLAVAPVFLLSALAATLSVLTTRLARVIDRARVLEARFDQLPEQEQRHAKAELAGLSERGRLIHRALTLGVGASLSVCLLIITAFVGYLTNSNLGLLVATLFIAAMGLFAFSLISFLREVFLSLDSLKFGKHAIVAHAEPAQR